MLTNLVVGDATGSTRIRYSTQLINGFVFAISATLGVIKFRRKCCFTFLSLYQPIGSTHHPHRVIQSSKNNVQGDQSYCPPLEIKDADKLVGK